MRDLRQSPNWAYYISHIGWRVRKVNQNQLFIKKFPLINRNFIKIQRPQNPMNLSLIDKIACEEKSLFVLIEPSIENYDEEKLIEKGFRKAHKMSLTHTATIHIDLTKSLNSIFKNFSENARRNIKKSANFNLKVKITDLRNEKDDKEFRTFYNLFSNLTKIKKFWAPGYDEYRKKMLGFKNNSILLFAYLDNKPIAAVWLGIFDEKAWYMNTGITNDGYQLLANYLLVWEAIKFSKNKKLKIFDFEGIFDPRFPKERVRWKSFSEFKKRFHGKIVEYPSPMIKIYSLPFKIFYLCAKIFLV